MEPYLVALGYGGSIKAAGEFEWNFRVRIGAQSAEDEEERQAFLQEFQKQATEGGSYAILIDDLTSPLVQVFMEFGKYAVKENPDLWLFLLLEEADHPDRQYRMQILADPDYELLMPNQTLVDVEGVPKEALRWLNRTFQMCFYEKDDEVMVEFPIGNIEGGDQA